MNDVYIQAENFVKEFGISNIPNFKNMNNDECRKYFKNLFISAIQEYKNDNFVEKALCIRTLLYPKSIFQYRPFDKDGFKLKSLEENYVWLSNPKDFNDPYDCAGCFDVEKALGALYCNNQDHENNYKINLTKKAIRSGKNYYDATLENLHLLSKEDKRNIINFEKNIISNALEKMEHSLKENTKISCFSETYNNILMWSHYADKHTGFCVEYDISNLDIDHKFKISFSPVIYTKNPVDISNAILSKRLDIVRNILLTNKSSDWEYEKEWRFITNSSVDSKFTMPITPKAIYIGTKIFKDNESKILQIAKQYKIPCYKLALKRNSFELAIEKDITTHLATQ